jgi:N utilization substance protein B
MSRRIAREHCMKALFQMSIQNDFDISKIKEDILEDILEDKQKKYMRMVLEKTIENLVQIDEIIEAYSKGWKINRISKVDLAILRLAFCELQFMEEVPYAVALNEAIELAKKFNSEESAAFVNGILGKYVEDKGLKDDEKKSDTRD